MLDRNWLPSETQPVFTISVVVASYCLRAIHYLYLHKIWAQICILALEITGTFKACKSHSHSCLCWFHPCCDCFHFPQSEPVKQVSFSSFVLALPSPSHVQSGPNLCCNDWILTAPIWGDITPAQNKFRYNYIHVTYELKGLQSISTGVLTYYWSPSKIFSFYWFILSPFQCCEWETHSLIPVKFFFMRVSDVDEN